MDIPKAQTLETEMNDSTVKHESISFETPQFSCSLLKSPEFIVFSTICFREDPNLLSILVGKLFKRMVVNVFVYHKYCKSHGCMLTLSLQLEHYC
jgi:hypothetical protein